MEQSIRYSRHQRAGRDALLLSQMDNVIVLLEPQ
jgi:hypothetical protein